MVPNKQAQIIADLQHASWAELNECIYQNESHPYVADTQAHIKSNPITPETIDELIKQGWHIRTGQEQAWLYAPAILGKADRNKKEITVPVYIPC